MPSKITIVLLVIVILLLGYLYALHGNAQEIDVMSRSAIRWMVLRWQWAGSDSSHSWLIPFISAALIWMKRKDLAAAPKSVSWMGLGCVLGALLLHWIGIKAQLTRISLVSLIGLLWAVPFYLCGRNVARLLLFPCVYLAFCIPMSFLNNLTVPLRIFASTVSSLLLNGFGIAVVRTGTVIASTAEGGFVLGVADPCSGLRSLLAMSALTAAYAYLTQDTLLKKWLLFLAGVPLAMAGNICRIVIVAMVASAVGADIAMKVYEQVSGFIVFAVAVLLMLGVARLLNVNYREKLHQWKHASTDIS